MTLFLKLELKEKNLFYTHRWIIALKHVHNLFINVNTFCRVVIEKPTVQTKTSTLAPSLSR